MNLRDGKSIGSEERWDVRYFYNGKYPAELIDLRREVYGNEMHFLDDENMVSENDRHGIHIAIYEKETQRIAASAHVVDAENSDFSKHSGVAREDLTKSIYGSRFLVSRDFRNCGLFSLLLYLGMREGRMRGRVSLIAYQNEGDSAVNKVIDMQPMTHVAKRLVAGRGSHQYQVIPCGQDIAYGMIRAWQKMPLDLQEFVAKDILADEVERYVAGRLETFYDNAWFNGVANRTLTRNQYVEMLGDWHQFVRWTTRLLAKVVGITDDKELRSNYIAHLNGEIDHEVMIESDLKYLGGDVDYVKKSMAPGKPIQLFMALQESIASFRQDPILFLAVPYSIEGISANIKPEILSNLSECVKSWGYEKPRKACTFIGSHVNTDGGDDGHWQASLKMIRKYLKTESDLQKFLVVSALVFDTVGASFENAISKVDYQNFKPSSVPNLSSTNSDILHAQL